MDEKFDGDAREGWPRRRWRQFSLRTLLVAAVLLGVPPSYVGSQIWTVGQRKAVLDLVVRYGGSYSVELRDKNGEGLVGETHVGPFGVQVGVLRSAVCLRSQIGPRNSAKIPNKLRRWLGDREIGLIILPRAAASTVIGQAEYIQEAGVWELQ